MFCVKECSKHKVSLKWHEIVVWHMTTLWCHEFYSLYSLQCDFDIFPKLHISKYGYGKIFRILSTVFLFLWIKQIFYRIVENDLSGAPTNIFQNSLENSFNSNRAAKQFKKTWNSHHKQFMTYRTGE